jgi:beta-1,4-mannosyl-glycoprotein beta-1,4-N-acetylglucosaminyltransferase
MIDKKRVVVDSFIFFNELDMLKFRLNYLNDSVDYFILVESTKSFTGNKKELFFENNKSEFEPFLHKIKHIIIDDLDNTNPWSNEYKQRDSISKGIDQLNLGDDDLIIISDVDEIPDRNTINDLCKNIKILNIGYFEQDLYYYNLNCKFNGKWGLSKVCTYSFYKEIKSPQKIRNYGASKIPNGGWHFSYFGDVNFIINKIRNFSHQEFNNSKFTDPEKIKKTIKENKDLYDRESQNITYTYIDHNKNGYLPENYEFLLKFNKINNDEK